MLLGARRQQPAVLPARRGGRGAGRRGGGHELRALDAVGHAARGGAGGLERAVLVPVYLCGGRDVALAAIARAKAAGFSALVVTIDTPVSGLRERDFRNGIKELLTRQSRVGASLRLAGARAAALARGLPRRRRADELPEHRPPRRADAVRRRRRGARPVGGLLGRPRAGCARRGAARSWSRACTRPTTRGAPSTRARARSSSRTTAVGSSTASPRRCACCPRWSRRWAAASRSCSTAASGAAATS